MDGVIQGSYGQAYLEKMKNDTELWTQRARDMKKIKKQIPNGTKASRLRDEYLHKIKMTGASPGADPQQVQNILVKMKKRGQLNQSALERRTNINRSVDMGQLPEIRRGKLEALKTEMADNRANVTVDDIGPKRTSKADRDELLSEYFSQKKKLAL